MGSDNDHHGNGSDDDYNLVNNDILSKRWWFFFISFSQYKRGWGHSGPKYHMAIAEKYALP